MLTRISRMNWRDLLEEVKYWDAFDLLRNFEEEMEHVRNGLIHWMLSPYMHFPQPIESRETMLLMPRISEKNGGIEIDFPNLHGVNKSDVTVEILNSELIVMVRFGVREEERVIGWFKLKIPENMSAETCEAEFREGSLKICLRRKDEIESRKIIAIQ